MGLSYTDFTEAAHAEKVQVIFEKHQGITLSERDFALFVTLIENPKPPTEELQAAMENYRRLQAAHPKAGF